MANQLDDSNPLIEEKNGDNDSDENDEDTNSKLSNHTAPISTTTTTNSLFPNKLSSLTNNNQSISRSKSPSRYSTSTTTPDRALNQKFHVAAFSGNLSVLKELLTKARLPIDCRDKENSTALLLTCARGHYDCSEFLIENGSDVNARRLTGSTALYFASSQRHTRIVELLLKNKSIVDISTFDGATSLHVASEKGYDDVVKLLVDYNSNVNAKMNDQTTALMLACQNGHLKVVQILIESNQKVDLIAQRLDGITAFFGAVQHGHEDIIDYLLEKKGNDDNFLTTIDQQREDGATPLFKACQKGYGSIVKKLLRYKPNINLLKNGESCLHAATMFSHLDIVKILIEYGSDALLNNWEGMTAVDLAKELSSAGGRDILDYLMVALKPKLSEHARQYLMHKSTRRTDADFDLDIIGNDEPDDWKLYKSLKSAKQLELLEEEIAHDGTMVIPTTTKKRTSITNKSALADIPHRSHQGARSAPSRHR
ncbi:unnamed protein product [Didymodactylos carnosus]|uniref:Uncharacterized protein n=1 Tax=Didymodactylos carnosus TaxID=1234261 RepID=A0A813RCP2_9BILA|nr:unnamed protein product [Didymodactylos carnosus]CAF0858777.1 unnamed protein product [Didymodactylos carnosus]CAF3563299.1 unnamed protein product [Didymodactylos carnosus]CAF3643762.1 unnamed protein product [Didymodactylos carnosus]